jgi:hypothetical protein
MPWWNVRVFELALLALSGLLAGVALGAARHRAPRPLVVTALVMAGVAMCLAILSAAASR